jgi:hypothetical protein
VGENADDFEQLRAELLREHDAQSALEFELVERLVGILWRLRRVPFFEAAILDARQADVEEDWEFLNRHLNKYHASEETEEEDEEQSDGKVKFGHALIKDAGFSDALGKLARHEATLMNAFTKTLQMLLLLQDKRGNTESKPVALKAVALPPAA